MLKEGEADVCARRVYVCVRVCLCGRGRGRGRGRLRLWTHGSMVGGWRLEQLAGRGTESTR